MKLDFRKFDKRIREIIRLVAAAAQNRDVPVYIVGGFVRDAILRRKNFDLDIVVEGDALGLAKAIARHFDVEVKFYPQFGTATLPLGKDIRLDLATARKESYPYPAALPVVAFGKIQDDLFRRDFSINAMAARIDHGQSGELVDQYNGIKDLRKGLIRVLHERSFLDDPTRIIRAVRFEQRFGFRIENRTLELLRAAVHNRMWAQVKPARYFEAFRKVLSEPSPVQCFRRMQELGILDFIAEGYACIRKDALALEGRIAKLRRSGFYSGYERGLVYLQVLAEGLSRGQAEEFAARFQLNTEESQAWLASEKLAAAEKRLLSAGLKPSEVYVILNGLPGPAVYYLRVRTQSRRVSGRVDQYLRKYRKVKVSLGGKDLQALGIADGPQMGKILKGLLLRKIDGGAPGRAGEQREAIRLITGAKEF